MTDAKVCVNVTPTAEGYRASVFALEDVGGLPNARLAYEVTGACPFCLLRDLLAYFNHAEAPAPSDN
jgi:hypothetical protein